ncbi:MAG: methyl-accepting chemotaxis protein [Sulfuricella sp.]
MLVRFFTLMRIRNQIILVMGTAMAMFVAAVSLALSGVSGTTTSFLKFLDKDQAKLNALEHAYAQGLQMGQALRNIVLDPANPKAYANMNAARSQFQEVLEHAAPLGVDDTEFRSLLAEISALRSRQIPIQDRVTRLVREGQQDAALAEINREETPVWRQMREKLLEGIKKRTGDTAATRESVIGQSQTTLHITLVICLIGFVLAVLASVLLAMGTVRPLQRTARAMNDIAAGEGDLSQRLPVQGKNEVAMVAEGFNKFCSKIEQSIVRVADVSLHLSSATAQLSEVSNQTEQAVKHQQSEIRQVADAVAGMSLKVSDVERHAQDAASAAQQADAEARNGKQVVDETISSINTLAEEVQRAAEVIQKLEEDSKGIGSILESIQGIADQTNLLALNAAIEAARAGDQGRGFAVVADEVRTLALRTQDATRKIQKMIGGLQSGAQRAAIVMQDGRKRTVATVKQATVAGQSLEKITGAVATISDMNAHIATAAKEQSVVAALINDNISNISAVAAQTAAGAHNTQKATGDLANMMSQLQTTVRQFKTYKDKGDFDFNAAKAAHLAWKARLRSFLDGESSLSMEQAVSHHHCMLGKWYYADGLAKYGHIPAMKQIEEPHAELHRIIKEIVQLEQNGKIAEAEQLFAKVEPISKTIIGLLDAVETSVRKAAQTTGV